MGARNRTVWLGALVASGSLAFAFDASAKKQTPPSADETCEEVGVVHFGVGSTKLDQKAQESLDEIAGKLQQKENVSTRVEAFADPSGPAAMNLALSEMRARNVEDYLKEQGVSSDRIASQGKGEAPDEADKPAPEDRVAVVKSCERTETAAETPPAPAAEEPPPPPPPEVATPEPVEPLPAPVTAEPGLQARAIEPRPMSGIGVGISAGAGVVDYTQSRARSVTDPGAMWDVRLTLGTRMWVGLDLAYVGSAQNLNVAGLSTDSYLLGNGGEAALRIQYPHGFVRPYIFGGAGWQHLTVERTSATFLGIQNVDNVGVVPFGVGLALGRVNGFLFDIQGAGRVTWDDDLLVNYQTNAGENPHLHTWAVTARVGGEF